MTTLELVLNMLAEATTAELSKEHQPEGFAESQEIARRGGRIAGQTRKAIEADTGKPVITSQSAQDFKKLITDIVEDTAALLSAEPKENGDNT